MSWYTLENRPTDWRKTGTLLLAGICTVVVLALFTRKHLESRAMTQMEIKNSISSGRVVDKDASDGFVTVRGKDGELHDMPAWLFSDSDARKDYLPPSD